MGDKKSQYRKTFKTMEQNMRNFIDQLDDTSPEPKSVLDFNFTSYWVDIVKISEKLCFEANKLSLAWINAPVPSNTDMVAMGACLEMACVAIVGAFHSFPSDCGDMVKTELRKCIKSVFESCLIFIQTLTDTTGKKFTAQNHPLVARFAQVMNSSDAVKKIPRSNKEACANILKENYDVLKDALSEINEVKSDDFVNDLDENDEQWSEEDHQIINPSTGLIKTCVALVKKTRDTLRKEGLDATPAQLADYDTIVEIISKLSPCVDDLALSLYPPLDWSECKNCNQVLKVNLESCLAVLEPLHFMQGDEAVKWREFVSKAVIHNFSEIQRVFISRGMAEMRVSDS